MNKINYLSISIIIVLLIGNGFLYFNLNKQNSGIKKDISDLKQEQISRQADQKEKLENLQNLVTFNWKEYQNDKFGFSFKYPEYVGVCDNTADYKEKNETVENKKNIQLNLMIGANGEIEACGAINNISSASNSIPPLFITIEKNTNNYKTAEEVFYKDFTEFSNIDKSLNKQLSRFDIAGSEAYGGRVIYEIANPNIIRQDSYGIIILKNDYIIKLSDPIYDEVFTNTRSGNKPIFDAIISSFRLNPSNL